MKKWLVGMWVSIIIAIILWTLAFIFISYWWGYNQHAIDYNVAYFSAPAYLNILNGIPFMIGTITFIVLSIICHRKVRLLSSHL